MNGIEHHKWTETNTKYEQNWTSKTNNKINRIKHQKQTETNTKNEQKWTPNLTKSNTKNEEKRTPKNEHEPTPEITVN